jgi:molybdate transport system ATP-binding protein
VAELVADVELARGDLQLAVKLRCAPGITCVMGRSGSGKSTLLHLLAGLTAPDRGTISLGDETWLGPGVDVPVHHRQLAYVFQGLALFPHMTALQNVMYAETRPKGTGSLASQAKARALLDRFGVGALAHRRPRTFSGGEAQRVALARALARSPKLVLLDEPFSALDRELRAQLVALVKELATELAVPIIHVTHSDDEARALTDHIVVMDRGKLTE